MDAYEKILRSVLDDPTLTDAEARLIGHLATRPPGWVVIPSVVAKDIKRNERYWVRPTLRLLAARGIITAERGRAERAQFTSVTYLVNRDELIAPSGEQNPRSGPATASQSMVPPAETHEEQENPQVGPRAASQSTVPPAETQKPRSDHGLSDRARSNNRRERTDKQTRTEKTLSVVKTQTTDQRGTRIPGDFLEKLWADKAQRAWAIDRCPDLTLEEVRIESERMFGHWDNATGRATKKKWMLAWRNWMLKAQLDAARRNALIQSRSGPPPQPGDDGWVQPVSPFRGMS
jgi:hypothetical protein